MEELSLVYVTASNRNEAMMIGEALVKEHLVACANIIDNMTSCYIWEGKLEKTREAVLIVKTRKALLMQVEEKIKKLHSYSCPCIVALPITHASREFSEWIIGQTDWPFA